MRRRQRKTPRRQLEELLETADLRGVLSTYDGGLSQLAVDAELSLAQLYRFTAGEGKNPPAKTASKIAGALGRGRDRILKLLKTADLLRLWTIEKGKD